MYIYKMCIGCADFQYTSVSIYFIEQLFLSRFVFTGSDTTRGFVRESTPHTSRVRGEDEGGGAGVVGAVCGRAAAADAGAHARDHAVCWQAARRPPRRATAQR